MATLGLRRGLTLSCAGVLALACASPAAEQVSPHHECIYGGQEQETRLGLSSAQRRAIVYLDITSTLSEGGETTSSCSGLLIAPDVLLTAAHCVEGAETIRVTVRGAAPNQGCTDAPAPGVNADATFGRHPTLDALLVRLAKEQLDAEAAPLEPAGEADGLELDDEVELAGYGWTESDSPGSLRFVVEKVAALQDEWIEVTGDGASGACTGDSGGPLLYADENGQARVAGVLSRGSASCVGVDRYTRSSALGPWLTQALPR